jgi:hypothetical protein
MTDIGSDTAAELGMLIDAYLALQKKDPNHELLALGVLDDDKMGIRFTPAYALKCVRADDPWRVHGYARYSSALKAAIAGQPVQLLDTKPPCEF